MMTVAKAAHEKGTHIEYDGYDWKKLSVDDWLDLLMVHPEFSEKCTANIWRQFNELDIRELLCKQPQFADKCNLSLLTPYFWVDILCEQPQLSDKCDWRYWEGSDWATLLRWQPQFAERCEWDKLDGCDWVRILEKQPQFFDRVSMEKLGDIESELWSDQARRRFDALWDNLMTAQPHFSIYRKPNQTYPQMTEEEILSRVLDMH
jgi:hypothetical protein